MRTNFALAGLVVGFLIGVSGVGGGALMAPFLLIVGIEPAVVVGSDLAFGLITKCAGVGLHARRDVVRWRWVWLMASGSIPGALAGSWLVRQLTGSPNVIRYWIGIMLVVAPIAAIALEYARHAQVAWVDRLQHPRAWTAPLLGVVIGTAVGATSVGSGSLIDIGLMLFSPLTGAEVVGTGIAHGIILSAVAALAHWRFGSVDLPLVFNLLAGSIPGVLLGSHLAHRSRTRPLRWGIAALVLVSGVSIISTVSHP